MWGYILGAAVYAFIQTIYWQDDPSEYFDDFHRKPPIFYSVAQQPFFPFIKHAQVLLDCTAASLLAKTVYAWLIWLAFLQPSVGECWLALVWLNSAYLLTLTDLYDYSVKGEILYPSLFLLAFTNLMNAQPFHWQNFLLLLPLFFFVWQEQLGDGDLFLIGGWAPWLSTYQLLWLLIIASCCGLLFFSLHMLFVRNQLRMLPFVPCLSLALVIVRFL
ncbi:hypothetical protein [Enterococcus gallinarum]|uniref:hypothetical protein n=1 Tax=Enterococcus gallinarum TaxID=1353 RepID=UPI00288EBC87|nr:hypothetical protein [Enterococcus gallinarum]MDT2701133.1 hypothetical protein [Enterococcus gallinarum]